MLYGDIPYVLDKLIGDVMWHCLFIDVCLCIEDSYFKDVYCFRSCVNMYCEGSLRHWCKLFLLQCRLLRFWMDFCVCTEYGKHGLTNRCLLSSLLNKYLNDNNLNLVHFVNYLGFKPRSNAPSLIPFKLQCINKVCTH